SIEIVDAAIVTFLNTQHPAQVIENLTVQSTASIDVSGLGWMGGAVRGNGGGGILGGLGCATGTCGGGGGGHIGVGGDGGTQSNSGGGAAATAGSGGGGGGGSDAKGGQGGGRLILTVFGDVTVNGSVKANGLNGYDGTTGGGGGGA